MVCSTAPPAGEALVLLGSSERTSGAELAEVLQKLLAGRAIKSCGK